MTHSSYWTASDGTQLYYRCAFLQKHFPEERGQ
jgi:hypothetical protein